MLDNSESKVCFRTLKTTLDNMQWKYEVKEEFFIATSAKGDNMEIPIFVGIDPQKPCLFIHAPMPFEIDPSKTDLFARALCEINFSMLIGSFDLDTTRNRIVYKATLPFMECLVSEAACKYMILLTCYMSDKFNSKLYDLNCGTIGLFDIIESVKN